MLADRFRWPTSICIGSIGRRRPKNSDWREALDGGAVVIEWPERLGEDLPADRLEVTLRPDPGDLNSRTASFAAFGSWRSREFDF